MPKKIYTLQDAEQISNQLAIDWNTSPFDIDQFLKGLNVEAEHGANDPQTNVTNDDPIMTGKIALAHLKEFSDYYIRLEKLEIEAEDAKKPPVVE